MLSQLLVICGVNSKLATKRILGYLNLEQTNSNSKKLRQLIESEYSEYLVPCRFRENGQEVRGYKLVKPYGIKVEIEIKQQLEVIEQQALEQVEEIKPTEQQQFLDIARNNLQQALKEHSWKLVVMYSKYIRQNL